MSYFRKKPVVIEAICNRGLESWADVLAFLQTGNMQKYAMAPDETIVIYTLGGKMTAQNGDWIIRGVKGELYPCKPDIFAATYEPVEDADEIRMP